MREHWIDNGRGLLSIDTDTMHISIQSHARKNYRINSSNWHLYFWVKGQYGYMTSFCCTFGGTMEEALNKAETIIREMFESIQEIL